MEGGGGRGDEGMTKQFVCRQAQQLVGMETLVEEISEAVGEIFGDGGG